MSLADRLKEARLVEAQWCAIVWLDRLTFRCRPLDAIVFDP